MILTDKKDSIKLKYMRSTLLYHIANDAYIIKAASDAGVEISDLCADGNISHVNREMRLAQTMIAEALYPLTKRPVREGGFDVDGDGAHVIDRYGVDGNPIPDYTIEFDLAAECMSASTAELLYNLIFEYLVAFIVADWLSIVAPDAAEVWAAKVSALRSDISSASKRTMEPQRIVPHWLG